MESILDLQNQSSLAKLLATENITVTHNKRLSTAYFDVKNRVLGLPVWKDQGKVVYDMLVGHEVSHALYTPHEEFEKFLEDEKRLLKGGHVGRLVSPPPSHPHPTLHPLFQRKKKKG